MDIEEIRRQKMKELQQQQAQGAPTPEEIQQQQEQERAAYEAQKKQIMKKILSEEARHRLANIKMVKPEFAEQVEMQLIQLAQSGRLPIPVSDEYFKTLLDQLYTMGSAKKKRDIKFVRK
jgi:programmed cell death protein 5